MAIDEAKMKIVINNCFKDECNVNTSIREAFEKGFRIGVKKGEALNPKIIRCKDCKHHWTHRCMDSMPTEICDLNQTFYDPNIDFCSLAERRTDGV